jgi:hypothetical protein
MNKKVIGVLLAGLMMAPGMMMGCKPEIKPATKAIPENLLGKYVSGAPGETTYSVVELKNDNGKYVVQCDSEPPMEVWMYNSELCELYVSDENSPSFDDEKFGNIASHLLSTKNHGTYEKR